MKMIEIAAPDFDLAKTLNSGQVFQWEKTGDGFIGTIGPRGIYLEQRGARLRVRFELDGLKPSSLTSAEIRRMQAEIIRYFALDHPLAAICASFPRDPSMSAARDFCRGLRIIRQPKWECLAMFICSSMKQVAHIRQISQALRERFGESIEFGDRVIHAFPSPQRIAQSSEEELRKCALGYRAKNLFATARLVAGGDVDLEQVAALPDGDLRAGLCQLPGVGAKVANCVMLFAYERLRAFPIDVWIERVLRQNYFPRARKLNASRLRVFTEEYFGEHGGYAQQYLFHHARTSPRNDRAVQVNRPCLKGKKGKGRGGSPEAPAKAGHLSPHRG